VTPLQASLVGVEKWIIDRFLCVFQALQNFLLLTER
jgi:hypothetical protein